MTEPSFDKLPKQQQEILKLSSLLGVRFDTIILNEILPTSLKKKWDINAEINLLIDEGYLIEGSAPEKQHMEGLWLHPRLAGNEFYCFLNDGVHQKVMAMTPSPDQKKKHRKIAQVYEEMYSEDLRPYLLPLAHHFGLGGHENKAFDYLKRAIHTALTALKTSELAVASDELSIRLLKRALVDLNGVELALQLARVVELDQVVKKCLREAGVPERTFASLQVSSGKKKRKKIKKKEEPLTDKEKLTMTKYRELLVFVAYISKVQGEMEDEPAQIIFDTQEIESWCLEAKSNTIDDLCCGDGKEQANASPVCVVS